MSLHLVSEGRDTTKVSDENRNELSVQSEPGQFCVTNCPIALIYGEGTEEVALLRDFRDNVLHKTPEGREIIRLYYYLGPKMVESMVEDADFKKEVEVILNDILEVVGGREK
jgi:hypothetical protein